VSWEFSKGFTIKKRKYDQPAVAKKPWTSKKGKIVPNTTTQMVIEDLAKTQEITPNGLPEMIPEMIQSIEKQAELDAAAFTKEKEVIDLIDSEESDSEGCDDMDVLEKLSCENCENCGDNIALCNCYDNCDDIDFHDSESYLDTDDYSEEESDDLFDI